MFGYRSDGKKIKDLPPIFKIMPCVMPERVDSQVYFKQDIALKSLDEYIDRKAEEGIKISYMNIVYAAIVKIIGERPNLNRFAMNGSLYQRNKVYVSLVIKKSLTDDGTETPIKLDFDGSENIFEIKNKLDEAIEKNKEVSNMNGTDKLTLAFSFIPNGLIRVAFKFLMFLDKHGLMPKKIIEVSPFHTSVFLTNVGSLGIDSIYHHIYNFGTTSMFFSMGKKKKSYKRKRERSPQIRSEDNLSSLARQTPARAEETISRRRTHRKQRIATRILRKFPQTRGKRIREVFFRFFRRKKQTRRLRCPYKAPI